MFGDLCYNLHNLPCICVKMAPTGTFFISFFHFLVIVGIKGEKGSLAHDKTLFGRRFCCLVIYANLQFAVYMHQNCSDRNRFTFLLSLGIKVEKWKLRTWQNMAWKAFLLFGDLC